VPRESLAGPISPGSRTRTRRGPAYGQPATRDAKGPRSLRAAQNPPGGGASLPPVSETIGNPRLRAKARGSLLRFRTRVLQVIRPRQKSHPNPIRRDEGSFTSPKTPTKGGQRTIADEQLSGRARPALLPEPLESTARERTLRAWDPRGIQAGGTGLWQSTHYRVRFFAPLCRPGRGRRGEAWPLHFFQALPTVCPAGPRGCQPRLISCMHHQQVFHKGPRVPGPSTTAEARLSPERDQAGGNRHRGRVPQPARAAGLSRVRRPA
jgi:hypothetical protein